MVSELPNCLADHICQELNKYISYAILGGNCHFYLKGIIWHTMSRQGSGMCISRRNYVRTGTVYLLKGPTMSGLVQFIYLKGPCYVRTGTVYLYLKGPCYVWTGTVY